MDDLIDSAGIDAKRLRALADTMPFYWNGEYHVFYLSAPGGHSRWEHIVSRDLVRWREGTLAFDDTPLAAIAIELGRWYDLEFRLADSLLARQREEET